MNVNKRALAEIFGISERTLTELQREGLPIQTVADRRGQANLYDTAEVHRWLLARAAGPVAGADGSPLRLDVERARLTHHQANLAEIEEATMRRELIPAEDVAREWADMVGRARAKLLGLPPRLAAHAMTCATVREAEEFARAEVYAALSELAETPDDDST